MGLRSRVDRHSIHTRVLILQGAGWITLLLLVAITAWVSARDVRQAVLSAHQQLAATAALQIDHQLTDDLQHVQALSGSPRLWNDLTQLAAERAALADAFYRSPNIAAIRLIAVDGRVLLGHPTDEAWPPIDTTATDSVLTTGRVYSAAVDGSPPHAKMFVPLRNRDGKISAVAEIRLRSDARQVREVLDKAGARLVARGPLPAEAATDALTIVPWNIVIDLPLPHATLQAWPTLRWALPLSFALAALFAWGTSRSVRRPVLALTAAAEQMIAGDLTTPLPQFPDDEIGRLGRVLEHLRVELHGSLQTISEHAQQLEQRVADRTRDLEEMCRRLHDRDSWRVQIVRKVISAQEDERRRLARELHDDTCQSLAALGVSLEAALAEMAGSAARPRLEQLKGVIDTSLRDLHRVIYDLRPSVLDDLGLVAGIRWLADEHLRRTGVSVRCEVFGLDERLPGEIETPLFRVVQEALINIERHANAETVLIQLSLEHNLLLVEIEDDGRGFDVTSGMEGVQGGRGLGLLGMRERVELLGGSLAISSSPGNGTRVAITVPVATAALVEQLT